MNKMSKKTKKVYPELVSRFFVELSTNSNKITGKCRLCVNIETKITDLIGKYLFTFEC
jgi:hypothetical protein